MRKKHFKTSLFGYNKKEVDSFVKKAEEKDRSLDTNEERMETLVKENVTLGMELKIARSGFVDAAELMQKAQRRVRELESQMNQERERMAFLANELKDTVQEMDHAAVPAEAKELVELLVQRVDEFDGESLTQLKRVLSDGDLLQKLAEEWDAIEGLTFSLPEGFPGHLDQEDTPESARGLMHRIFLLRQEGRVD
ncbi:DivIVA domain-containing protein [Eubacteriales bacterium OttesenSCG-928-M02]|nr:DivIVA domain-containing protein [Eubacteriales bacterium OttesenSCG-928-M02]